MNVGQGPNVGQGAKVCDGAKVVVVFNVVVVWRAATSVSITCGLQLEKPVEKIEYKNEENVNLKTNNSYQTIKLRRELLLIVSSW